MLGVIFRLKQSSVSSYLPWKASCRIILYGNTTTGYSLPGKPRLFSRERGGIYAADSTREAKLPSPAPKPYRLKRLIVHSQHPSQSPAPPRKSSPCAHQRAPPICGRRKIDRPRIAREPGRDGAHLRLSYRPR